MCLQRKTSTVSQGSGVRNVAKITINEGKLPNAEWVDKDKALTENIRNVVT